MGMLLCLFGLIITARGQGTVYNAPVTAGTYATRMWVPDGVPVIRGVVIWGNGFGGNSVTRAEDPDWQAFARAHGFAMMGTGGFEADMFGGEGDVILNDLAWYATASNQPSIEHAPIIFTGHSNGGQMAYEFNAWNPKRVIAFSTSKGGVYSTYNVATDARKTPGLIISGEDDSDYRITTPETLFDNNRPKGALWAFAIEENTGHSVGNSYSVWMAFFDHAIRARYPANVTPLNGPVTLNTLSESSGWLCAKPTLANGVTGPVYPYADYPGDKSKACWLMDEDVARLFKGFATYNPRIAFSMTSGVYTKGQLITISCTDATVPTVDVYDGAVKLGTLPNGGATSMQVMRPWGGRGIVLRGLDTNGIERTSSPKWLVIEDLNRAPVANAQNVAVKKNTAKSLTLTGSDVELNPLTYSIVTNPSNGTLSGVAPNLVYTPNAEFLGLDTFTFKANDGTSDSIIATVSISVSLNGSDAMVSIAATTATSTEGSATPAVFTLTRAGITTGSLSVNLTASGTALSGTDYTAISSPIVFAANVISKTISVTPVDDAEYEGDETVMLTVASGTGYQPNSPSSATVSIVDNDKPTVSVTSNLTTATEGSTSPVLTFARSGITSLGPLTVNYALTGSATVSSDYVMLSGSITIPLNAASVNLPLAILQDDVTEAPETLIVTLSSNAAYNTATAPANAATITLLDDSEPVALNITASDNVASEPTKGDGTGTFTITRSGSPTTAITVNLAFGGTSTAGSDFPALPNTVTIPSGQTSVTVTITPTDDSEAEMDETVILTLQAGSGYSIGATSSATINLYDDEANLIRVEVSDAKCIEGATADNGNFVLRRLGNRTAAVTVKYTRTGTATSDSDFTALTGTATINANSGSSNISVAPINDTLVEGTETVILTLANGTGYAIDPQKTGTIEIRDDETVDVNLTVGDANCAEQATPDTGIFRITRSAVAATSLTVSYTIAGTATSGTDFTTLTGTATIAANEIIANIDVTPINDGILEGTETIIMTLTGAGATYDIGDARTQTIWIKDDDTPNITLVATDNAAAEADGGTTNQGLWTFTASFAPASNLTIHYTAGSSNGIDCVYLPGSIVLPAGQTSVTLPLIPIDDELPEGLENLGVTLAYGDNYNLSTTSGVNISIAASDKPTATVSAFDPNAAENPVKTGRFLVTLSKTVAGNTSVTYTVAGTATATSDYTALSGTVTVSKDSNTAIITVTPVNDALAEGNETVSITLNTSTSYTLGTPDSATVSIGDDETVSTQTAWKQGYFGANATNESISGDLVDYDSDGMSNLLEYAFGCDPTLATSAAEKPQADTASGSLKMTFNRVLANNDIIITVQASDTLSGTWTDLASSVYGATTTALVPDVTVSETGTGATRSVAVTDSIATNDPAHPRRFLRIRVTH